MAGLMDEVMGALGGADGGLGGLLGQITGSGAGQADGEKAAGLGVEAILGGLAANTKSRRGAQSLHRTLDRHDGSALDDVSRLGSAESTADGQKILHHVFGKNQDAVAQGIAAKSGMDMGSIAKMLPALAPVVMGMLGKKKAQGTDAAGLAGLLGNESGGFDLGDIMGLLGKGTGSGGVMGMLKGLLGR